MRQVTERDLRMPEFVHAKVEELEFRDDGKIVRKDRWERTVRSIAGTLVGSRSAFECEDIVAAVEKLVADNACWTTVEAAADYDDDDYPAAGSLVDLRLNDGSLLRQATAAGKLQFMWGDVDYTTPVVTAWRDSE